ncbi:MAG: phosphoribosylaminoimidazolesuccinocarboxamide synthase [Calditrichia bacterium]|nr:phosphoribosylaminoimidazolesuccinocarboxamide synthase [Calditrichia bacterium]MCK5452933.1 phosphoribosylaminoimidazolesuccinocarboxamide synthase [Calditrichia bacterium]NOQ96973.1 phosphoribosylaminoimidazolesuccinocarboxamide synthase [Calditrichia bacterium]
MKGQEKFAEGRTKNLYKTDQEEQLMMEFLDVLPFESAKKVSVKEKGKVNTDLSSYLFEYLHSYNVPTHFLKKVDSKNILVKKLNMIPIEMVIWNIATTGLSKKLGISEGAMLETPVIEFYLKDAKLKYPMINDYHAYALGLCDRNDMSAIVRIGTKINAVLRSFFQRKNLSLVKFTLEFGKVGNQVMLGDEVTPDTFIVWGVKDDGKVDKKTYTLTPETAKQVYPRLHEILLK